MFKSISVAKWVMSFWKEDGRQSGLYFFRRTTHVKLSVRIVVWTSSSIMDCHGNSTMAMSSVTVWSDKGGGYIAFYNVALISLHAGHVQDVVARLLLWSADGSSIRNATRLQFCGLVSCKVTASVTEARGPPNSAVKWWGSKFLLRQGREVIKCQGTHWFQQILWSLAEHTGEWGGRAWILISLFYFSPRTVHCGINRCVVFVVVVLVWITNYHVY